MEKIKNLKWHYQLLLLACVAAVVYAGVWYMYTSEIRAEVAQLNGNWDTAWNEATAACDHLADPFSIPLLGMALYQRAELRRLRGELDADQVGRAGELLDGHAVQPGAPFRAGRDERELGVQHLLPAAGPPALDPHATKRTPSRRAVKGRRPRCAGYKERMLREGPIPLFVHGLLEYGAGVLLIACILTAGMLTGCDQRDLVAEITPREDEEFAKHYVSLFQKSDFAAIESAMDAPLKTPQLKPTLALMASMLPSEQPVSITERPSA